MYSFCIYLITFIRLFSQSLHYKISEADVAINSYFLISYMYPKISVKKTDTDAEITFDA